MPDLGEGLTEGEVNRWLVAEGDTVVVDQPVAEITTEKAVVEVPTPFAGRVAKLHGAEGETIGVGKPLISIEVAGAPAASESGNVLVGYGTSEAAPRSRRSVAPAGTAGSARSAASPPASPLVRRLAAELGVDLATIAGSGPGGMVTQADLERGSRKDGATPENQSPPAVAGGKRISLTGVDRIAAERLTRSHREAPTATAFVRADATRLMELRAELPPGTTDASVTPFAIILRLCVIALRRFPRLNAHFDTEANAIVHYLFDACAARGNLRGQIRQSAGPIADDSYETREPSIGNKAAFDDPAQDIGINISATKEKDDAFAGNPDELWRTAIERKGDRFALLAGMPFDPSLN